MTDTPKDAVEEAKDGTSEAVANVAEAVAPGSTGEASPVHEDESKVVGLLETVITKLDELKDALPGAAVASEVAEELTDGDGEVIATPISVPWTHRKLGRS